MLQAMSWKLFVREDHQRWFKFNTKAFANRDDIPIDLPLAVSDNHDIPRIIIEKIL